MLYSKCVFKPHGTVNYELNVNKFYGTAGAIRHAGMLLNSFYFSDKPVGLAHSLSSELVNEARFNIL